jgi:AraC family transcriptional regulator
MSVRRFRRAFRACAGVPPHVWLLRYQIDQAIASLRAGSALLPEIALRCGFADEQHLADVFSKRLGNPPQAFQDVGHARRGSQCLS